MTFIFEFKNGSKCTEIKKNVEEAIVFFRKWVEIEGRLHEEGKMPCPNPPIRLFKEMLVEIAHIDDFK